VDWLQVSNWSEKRPAQARGVLIILMGIPTMSEKNTKVVMSREFLYTQTSTIVVDFGRSIGGRVSAAHRSNAIKQTAKQINQICQNLISNQTNLKRI
jgi:hypothetical protein